MCSAISIFFRLRGCLYYRVLSGPFLERFCRRSAFHVKHKRACLIYFYIRFFCYFKNAKLREDGETNSETVSLPKLLSLNKNIPIIN